MAIEAAMAVPRRLRPTLSVTRENSAFFDVIKSTSPTKVVRKVLEYLLLQWSFVEGIIPMAAAAGE